MFIFVKQHIPADSLCTSIDKSIIFTELLLRSFYFFSVFECKKFVILVFLWLNKYCAHAS